MRILVLGGAGYVGSALVPALLARGHHVTILDWYLYGDVIARHQNLLQIKGDLRENVKCVDGQDAIIHLACISNDPSFELDPELGKSVNYDALKPLVERAKGTGTQRFIYASSSSVYGVKPDGVEVTEELLLEPLTDYSRFKAMGESVVLEAQSPGFTTTVLRPATLCGYAPRLRLDLIVNAMTKDAVHTGTITVHGGSQRRPNLHVDDMVRAYIDVLDAPVKQVAGQVFNVGGENATALDLAERIQAIAGGKIQTARSNDLRSYAINSERIRIALDFTPQRTIEDAVEGLCLAFAGGLFPDALTDPRYYNIQQMQLCHIS